MAFSKTNLPQDETAKMINYNEAFTSEKTIAYITDALQSKHVSGDGKYTKQCHLWLEKNLKCTKALLTHSCTAALEMSAMLSHVKPGDEIIMPSFTFVSTANAFVLRGATPVFVDIRPDTLNIDEAKIEAAISPRTKAIAVVHYAGVSCEMDAIMAIARKHNLIVIEDAAQTFGSFYKNVPLGTIGDMGTLSFHETKNIMSGEGGALILNRPDLIEQAEILREKGTNRSRFFRGQVDKYTWVDIGSSYLPSDILAAYLYSLLEISGAVTQKRLQNWEHYNEAFAPYEKEGILRRPVIPGECQHNGHIFYLLLNSLDERARFINFLKNRGIMSVFHYIPLHSAPAGLRFGKSSSNMEVTNSISERLVRLPLYFDMSSDQQCEIIEKASSFFNQES